MNASMRAMLISFVLTTQAASGGPVKDVVR
jgi:hypothetical protein